MAPLGLSSGAPAKAYGLPRTRIEPANQAALQPMPRCAKAQIDFELQVAGRDLGKILDGVEPVNKPEAA